MGVSLDICTNSRQSSLLSIHNAKDIYNLIDQHKVTHFGGAPIVLNLIANAEEKDKKEINHKIMS